jgi:hypothetical protein
MSEYEMPDEETSRENELFEKWTASGLTSVELEEGYKLLGVGAEWSTGRRDRYIRGNDHPWNAAHPYYDNVILAVEEMEAERGGEEV